MPAKKIAAIVRAHFGREIEDLHPIPSGQISETYGFEVQGVAYVIRFARIGFSDTLHKDQYVCENLLEGVPVAKFVTVGELGQRTYAITERAKGKILDELTPEDYEQLIPELVRVLDCIHQTDVSTCEGWGDFDRYGVGRKPSLQAFLLNLDESPSKDDGGFFGDWHQLFDQSYLDRKLFYQGLDALKSLLVFIPTRRFLVHHDYAFDNVLADQGQVTAVIDWANAVYGDFVMDIARLEFYSPQHQWADRFALFYEAKGQEVPDFRKRVLCYSLYSALDAMRFYAVTDQEEAYRFSETRLNRLLS